jgi:hypothetical protein
MRIASLVTCRLPQAHNWRVFPQATLLAGRATLPNQTLCFAEVHRFLTGLFDGDMHDKRVLSLANATLGVIRTASLAVNTVGQSLPPRRC